MPERQRSRRRVQRVCGSLVWGAEASCVSHAQEGVGRGVVEAPAPVSRGSYPACDLEEREMSWQQSCGAQARSLCRHAVTPCV